MSLARSVMKVILLQPTLLQRIMNLFRAGEQGCYYDFSDLTTLFQDSAGTTPVTAVEQPVGKVLDKSGRGNHLIQATASKRPTLSARVNLLTYSEDFSNAAWNKSLVTVTAEGVITDTAGTGFHFTQNVSVSLTAGTVYVLRCRLEKGTALFAGIHYNDDTARGCSIDLTTGTLGTPYGGATATATADGAGWIVTVTATCGTTTAAGGFAIYVSTSNALASYVYTTPLSVTATRCQIETGSTATRYQRINAATDYDTVGFKRYLKFDGVDDALATAATVDFSATDKMTVWAGVRKLSDAAFAAIAETSGFPDGTAGTFGVGVGVVAGGGNRLSYGGALSGSTVGTTSAGRTYTAPSTDVVVAAYDIAGATQGAEFVYRVNGAAPSAQTFAGTTAGTGNFTAQTLYVGARAGTSSYFNGNLYSLIIRGAASTPSQIAAGERWVNGKTGVTL